MVDAANVGIDEYVEVLHSIAPPIPVLINWPTPLVTIVSEASSTMTGLTRPSCPASEPQLIFTVEISPPLPSVVPGTPYKSLPTRLVSILAPCVVLPISGSTETG